MLQNIRQMYKGCDENVIPQLEVKYKGDVNKIIKYLTPNLNKGLRFKKCL